MDIEGEFIELLRPLMGQPITVVITIILAAFGWWAKLEWSVLGNPGNPAFERRITLLEQLTLSNRYTDLLISLLNKLSIWFGPELPPLNAPLLGKLFTVQPWTAISFGRLALLAMVYPLVFIVVGWLITGHGLVGNLEVLAPRETTHRILTALTLVSAIYCFYKYTKEARLQSIFWFGASINLLLITTSLSDSITLAVVFAVAIVFAVAGAFSTPSAFSFAFIVTLVVAVADTVIFAFALGIGFSVALALALAVAMAAVFGLALTDYYAMSRAYTKQLWQRAAAGYFFWMFSNAIAVYIVARHGEGDKEALTLLLFMACLPVLNLPFDWLSLGLTRGLLRSIQRDHNSHSLLLYTVIDIVAALVLLILVALSTVLGVMIFNAISVSVGGSKVVDLGMIYSQLHNGQWRETLWIWLMLGSTLIPTFLHFGIALFALIFVVPSNKATVAAGKLQAALDEHRALEDKAAQKDNPHFKALQSSIDVDSDARLFAWGYLVARKLLFMFVGLIVAAIALLLLYGFIQYFIASFPSSIGTLMQSA